MKTLTLLFSILFITNSFSAFNALSHHSRANCGGFNETISWWWGIPFYARVESYHYPKCLQGSNDNVHLVSTSKDFRARHAAYHATESYGGTYCVSGLHYMYQNGKETLVKSDIVSDCSIYDGWWDY